MKWNIKDPYKMLARALPGEGKLSMILDTDTYNEVDDQFALSLAMLSTDRLDVQAVYAAPYFNDRSTGPKDGMEKSYEEILRLLEKLGKDPEGFAFRGSEMYLPDEDTPVDSPAARDLVSRAMAWDKEEPLYVVAIGAITNVSSALLMEPKIVDKISVIWLGGSTFDFSSAADFNLIQDVPAARVLFDCGVPLTIIPAWGVTSHLLASVPELEAYMGGKNPLCDMLIETFAGYVDDHFGWAKEIWDIGAIAYMINPDWMPTKVIPSPLLTDDGQYGLDPLRHPVRIAYMAKRNPIFKDMYRKLTSM